MTPTDRGATITLPDLSAIPGLRFREGISDGDYEALSALVIAANRADGVPYMPSAANLREEYDTPGGFDPRRDVIVGELDGRLVVEAGTARAERGGMTVFEPWGHVHPDVRRRGIGRAVLEENLRRARSRAAAEAPDRVVEVRCYVEDGAVGHRVIVEARGFAPIRWYFTMRRPTLDDLPDAPLPAGLELRPLMPEQYRTVWDADVEAFRDHWQAREPTEEEFASTFAKADFDPGLWAVAWDGAEIAGVVQPWVWKDENAVLGVQRGWIEHISVRRPWRGRGLGRALTVEGLRRLRDAGMTDAMLGVDADNPTGALRLYESLGFRPEQRLTAYRLPLPR